jgi:hypothetical protein
MTGISAAAPHVVRATPLLTSGPGPAGTSWPVGHLFAYGEHPGWILAGHDSGPQDATAGAGA